MGSRFHYFMAELLYCLSQICGNLQDRNMLMWSLFHVMGFQQQPVVNF